MYGVSFVSVTYMWRMRDVYLTLVSTAYLRRVYNVPHVSATYVLRTCYVRFVAVTYVWRTRSIYGVLRVSEYQVFVLS